MVFVEDVDVNYCLICVRGPWIIISKNVFVEVGVDVSRVITELDLCMSLLWPIILSMDCL